MSFYPPVPISFSISGDEEVAARFKKEGRRRAGELFNFLSGGYGNPFYDDLEGAGKSGPFYYLTGDGSLVTINVKINRSLTYVYIDEEPYRPEYREGCFCCRDCLTIGTVIEATYPNGEAFPRYIVDICFSKDPDVLSTARIVDGIHLVDGNTEVKPGDRYIVFASPVLRNPPLPDEPGENNYVPDSTGLHSWTSEVDWINQTLPFRRSFLWQIFNCMEASSIEDEEVDLTPVGLDNSLYVVPGSACTTGGSVPLKDPEETEPAEQEFALVQFYLTSIRAGDCLEFI